MKTSIPNRFWVLVPLVWSVACGRVGIDFLYVDDAATDSDSNTGLDSDTHLKSDTGADSATESESSPESDTGVDSATESESESSTGPDSDTGVDSASESESSTGPDSDTSEVSSDSGSQDDTDTASFSHHRSILINHELVGTNNSGTLPAAGFPVLISLSGDWLKTVAGDPISGRIETSDGRDIAFRGSDGATELFYEVERYDGTNGLLVAWVRLASLSKAADTTIYIYYGNPDAGSSNQNPADVWDESYKGVWHLDEEQPGTGSTRAYTDATSNDNHGDDHVSAAGKEGKILRGQEFDDLDDFVLVPYSPELNITGDITISSWVRRTQLSNYGCILTKTNTLHWDFEFLISSNPVALDKVMFWSDDTVPQMRYSSGGITDAAWHHVAATRSGNTVTFYIDGAVSGVAALDGALGGHAYPLRIGDSGENGEAVFHGYLDEVRLSNIARSADWIVTSYNNQRDTSIGPDTFIKSVSLESSSK